MTTLIQLMVLAVAMFVVLGLRRARSRQIVITFERDVTGDDYSALRQALRDYAPATRRFEHCWVHHKNDCSPVWPKPSANNLETEVEQLP